MAKKYLMLLMADSRNNHNKFYEIRLEENDEVRVRYGRVDGGNQTASKGFGLAAFERVAREKKAKGYREVEVVVKTEDGKTQRSLSEVAKRDIIGNDPVLGALMERLVQMNRHQLMAASGGRITIEDGKVKTPVGLITLGSVQSAKIVLGQLEKMVRAGQTASDKYLTALNDYLTLVPQKVPSRGRWGPTFFDTHTTFQNQSDLLEQLEASLEGLEAERAKEEKDSPEIPEERVFSYSISQVSDKKTLKEIEKIFTSQLNRMHASSSLRLKTVYEMKNPEAEALYSQVAGRIGNEMRLWHGTRACNLLSILKSGLIVPKSSQGNYTITGRMFGDGLYFSDQSTKSLNYSYGYWGHGQRDRNCFMFLCDVAMGKPYVPSCSGDGKRKGYDSCFAQAGKSGVHNNEMIVYDISQARLRYLCEFH